MVYALEREPLPSLKYDVNSTRIYTNDTKKIIYPELSYKVTGTCFEVQRERGRFSRERQYCNARESKLRDRGIRYEREKTIKNSPMNGNRVDFIVDNKILLEIKSVPYITHNDYFQVQRYLNATGIKLAMIVNFRSKYLKPKRIVNNAV